MHNQAALECRGRRKASDSPCNTSIFLNLEMLGLWIGKLTIITAASNEVNHVDSPWIRWSHGLWEYWRGVKLVKEGHGWWRFVIITLTYRKPSRSQALNRHGGHVLRCIIFNNEGIFQYPPWWVYADPSAPRSLEQSPLLSTWPLACSSCLWMDLQWLACWILVCVA